MTADRSNLLKQWAIFVFLGFLGWGTSFLWIKIALAEVGPFTLVFYRVAFGCSAAWLLLYFLKLPIRISRAQLRWLIVLAFINTALPFILISWAEVHIDSGIAGILNSSMPLWAMLVAHFALPDERITLPKFAGLITGFAGIILLLSGDVDLVGLQGSLWAKLAVVMAAIAYSFSVVIVRARFREVHPLITSTVSMTFALIVMAVISPIVEYPFALPRLPLTWLACAWLGIIGVSLSLTAYFYLINHWGATRASLVTYVFPVAAVALGAIFLGERPGPHEFLGGALVIGGIALVNLRRK